MLRKYLRNMGKKDDLEIVSSIWKNRKTKVIEDNKKNRQDVHAKKLLRSAKEYYEQKMESKLQYKRDRRNNKRTKQHPKNPEQIKNFLAYVD